MSWNIKIILVDENLSFSKLMSLFCENVVNGRKELFKG